jgi:hypothetical protein
MNHPMRDCKQMKSLLIPIGLLTALIGLIICAPIARGNDLQSGHSLNHDQATRNATDSDSYIHLYGEVALAIEGKVIWTGSAKRDADAALLVFKQELAKIDPGTAPAGLNGGTFDPEWFQVAV